LAEFFCGGLLVRLLHQIEKIDSNYNVILKFQ
jgi:hypothetical protein